MNKERLKEEKEKFLTSLKELSGLPSYEEIEKDICDIFHQGEEGKFLDSLSLLIHEVIEYPNYRGDIKMSKLITEKSNKAFASKEFISNFIAPYKKRYEMLTPSDEYILTFKSSVEYANEVVFTDKILLGLLQNIKKELSEKYHDSEVGQYIYENASLILEMDNIRSLRAKIWISYFQIKKEDYIKLIRLTGHSGTIEILNSLLKQVVGIA